MSFFDRLNDWARRSVTLKLIIIGVLILFLLIPTALLDDLIRGRQRLRDNAQVEVASKWGLTQEIGGPVISVPYREEVIVTVDDEQKISYREGYAHFLPDEINIDGQLDPEQRYRGLFVVVLYNTQLKVQGRFDGFDAAALGVPAEALQWSKAKLIVGISDMTGVQSAIDVNLNGKFFSMGPGVPNGEVFASGASQSLPLDGSGDSLIFNFDLNLNGSSAIYFRPFGKQTNVKLTGGWGDPSFDGTFLPKEREVSTEGFSASWEVLQLNRNYPQQGTGSYIPKSQGFTSSSTYYYDEGSVGYNDGADRFGLRLLLPVDEYKKIYRSTNFAYLFIFITFLAYFFIEVLNRRRVHPIQYLLIGAAILLFYVMLLSISEHLTFNTAYWISAVAVAGLISMYSWFILRNTKLTALIGAMLMILYLYFFSLLQLQDYALLFGSIGLFLILAVIMYLTRNVDWYGIGQNESKDSPPAA
ncbi:cell envelope integrity protein CreD [Lewinellaceae bacterium SD302]|nr:cell envelope integrity protein CreD [Lewinellaceae bacterium SD302]